MLEGIQIVMLTCLLLFHKEDMNFSRKWSHQSYNIIESIYSVRKFQNKGMITVQPLSKFIEKYLCYKN